MSSSRACVSISSGVQTGSHARADDLHGELPRDPAREEAARAEGAAESASALASLDPLNEYPSLERYIVETLRQTERIRLKLLSPIGVVRHVVGTNLGSLETRLQVVHEDGKVLRSIRDQLERYVTEMRADSQRYLADVKNILYEIERRGRSGSSRRSASATSGCCATRTRSRIDSERGRR